MQVKDIFSQPEVLIAWKKVRATAGAIILNVAVTAQPFTLAADAKRGELHLLI